MKKLFLTLLVTGFGMMQAFSQITYHDINPDTTVNTWNAFTITPIPATASSNLIIWWHPSPEVVAQTWGNCEILFDAAGTVPLKLNAGDSITAGGKWKMGNYDALSSGGSGNWTSNATDKYLGFRIKNGTVWNYGWVKMSVAAGAASFTVKEWAFEASGKRINTGQTAATGVQTIASVPAMHLYPNPASDKIQLQWEFNGPGTIAIANISGRIIKIIDIVAGTKYPVIDINELASGTYYITAKTGEAGSVTTSFSKL